MRARYAIGLNLDPVVYRMYDRDGVLLYIGSTTNLKARIEQHFANRYSCADPEALRERFHALDTEAYATIEEARAAEKAAIRAEAPLLNRQHNPTRWRLTIPGNVWKPVEA